MSIKECTDLTSDQLDWLVEHYYHPMKLKGTRDALPEISIQLTQLESAGLVKVERFPVINLAKYSLNEVVSQYQYTVLVVTSTARGYALTVQAAPGRILQRWGHTLSDQFLEKSLIPYLTLAALPELLVGDNVRWRNLAIEAAGRS